MSDIWQFQQALTRRLAFWAAGSILLGLGMLLFRDPFWNGMAFQFIAWGGMTGARKRRAKLIEEQAAAGIPQETRNLRRILWVNTGLDALYVLGGMLLALFQRSEALWLGAGLGIVIQGGFLFFFDWLHARQLPKV